MSKIEELQIQSKKLRAEYHEKANIITRKEDSKLTQEIVTIDKQISSLIAEGAKNCPSCSTKENVTHAVFGMIKRESYRDGSGQHSGLFEIGCNNCVLRSQGITSEEAVHNWNKDEYIPPRRL